MISGEEINVRDWRRSLKRIDDAPKPPGEVIQANKQKQRAKNKRAKASRKKNR